MGVYEMVLGIVVVVMIASVFIKRYEAQNRIPKDADGNPLPRNDEETRMLMREVQTLQERVKVLERIITDERESRDLAREIEDLRQ